MPSVAFITLGCKVNQFETETLEGLFLAQSYKIVGFDEVADVYVINTCSVTHLGEKKSRQFIRRANRLNPAAVVVVTGCYAQIAAAEVAAIEGVDVIVGTQNRQGIVNLVESAAKNHTQCNAVTNIMSASTFEEIPLLSMPSRQRAFLKIQEGCTNFCSYCIIPYTRGPLRSRPLSGLLNEVRKLVAAQFKEIVLTGIHLGAYGRDLIDGVTLADAVQAVANVDGVVRIRLSSLESIEVSAEMIALFKHNAKLCHHLHLPLQSGSDPILQAMNRPYTTAEYRSLIANIVRAIPDIAISTDVIVGFPGETAELFRETMDFVRDMKFSKMHIFPYSPRAGTAAADFPCQVPEKEKKERAHLMHELAMNMSAQYASRFVGKSLPVLLETYSNNTGSCEGHTGNYLKVTVASADESAIGTIKNVFLTGTTADGLQGELQK
jgi:threonylcarbamoyladenosine tRNA methylthiotransferase MtaB